MANSNNPLRCLISSPEVIRGVVILYVRVSRSLRQVENLRAQRDIDICHEAVRPYRNLSGPVFAGEIRSKLKGLCRGKFVLSRRPKLMSSRRSNSPT